MANRHLSRSIVLQSLFEWDFNGKQDDIIVPILKRNESEFGPGLDDFTFIENLAELVLKKRSIIDEIITKAAPDWPIDKISVVDRNILRLGLAELLFGNREEVPPKVAINEAIELAKAFGGETSSKFVNGVLGAVYKEIGEPGKDQTSKKKKDDTPVDITKLPTEKKAGAVIYARHEGAVYFALVHDVFGYWTLSKGGVEDGEDEAVAVVREIKDEVGLPIVVKEKLGQNEYVASHPEKGKIRKEVHYFLVEAPYQELALTSSGGLDDAKWFSLSQIGDIKTYDDILPLLAKSIEKITK
ncbi:MAG: transcription antitermination factor NusB [Candidatus Pacebacteria bacterium]|nr:transcription antitermination factor NusB [Candidatus Paceibacterota bacterium]MBP9772744.1 transcription antitermination factor NusB [Candidatus Paceibacterota bacterium]